MGVYFFHVVLDILVSRSRIQKVLIIRTVHIFFFKQDGQSGSSGSFFSLVALGSILFLFFQSLQPFGLLDCRFFAILFFDFILLFNLVFEVLNHVVTFAFLSLVKSERRLCRRGILLDKDKLVLVGSLAFSHFIDHLRLRVNLDSHSLILS